MEVPNAVSPAAEVARAPARLRHLVMTSDRGESLALSVFLRDGDDVFRTDVNSGRDVAALDSVRTFLDLTPLGRQQAWEDTPDGRRQGDAYSWSRRLDDYPTEVLR
jgi:predicted dithiol-disulfide oxidoreductase (DUF899 family)